jgi:hypothetical protein
MREDCLLADKDDHETRGDGDSEVSREEESE